MLKMAHIHSQNGQMDEVDVLYENGFNDVVVMYHGVKYQAIFNPFTCSYYVDDIYGEIHE